MKKLCFFAASMLALVFSGCCWFGTPVGCETLAGSEEEMMDDLSSGSGCFVMAQDCRKAEVIFCKHENKFDATLLQLASPDKFQSFEKTDEIPVLTMELRDIAGLNVPLDCLIRQWYQLKSGKPGARIKLVLPVNWQQDLVSMWNVYAALRIASGKFDPERDLDEFTQKYCGSAAAEIKEYLVILERTALIAATLSGHRRQSELTKAVVFTVDDLKSLRTLLNAAVAKVSGEEAALVRHQLKIFEIGAKDIECAIVNRLRKIRSNGEKQEFVARYGDPAALGTNVKINADNRGFTLTFECKEPEMSKLKDRRTMKNPFSLWKDDNIELFLMPSPGRNNDCWQIILTAGGAYYSIFYADGKAVDGKLLSGITTRRAKHKDSWEVSITIPWSSFGLKQKPVTPWHCNFVRNRLATRPYFTTVWTPYGDFKNLDPQYFGTIYWNE